MATRKKKSDWLDDQVDELNDAFAEKVFDKKTKKAKWPKITKGSHLTVITHENGRTELVWDDEALLRDVRAAILKAESSMPVAEKKPAVKAKAEVQKKKAAAMTARPKKEKK